MNWMDELENKINRFFQTTSREDVIASLERAEFKKYNNLNYNVFSFETIETEDDVVETPKIIPEHRETYADHITMPRSELIRIQNCPAEFDLSLEGDLCPMMAA